MRVVLNQSDRESLKRLRATCDSNYRLTRLYSRYLSEAPRLVSSDMISELTKCGITEEHAFGLILSAAFGLDTENSADDRRFERDYILPSIKKLDPKRYTENPYYKNIRIPDVTSGKWQLKNQTYEPYQGFICDDLFPLPDYREISKIGFFSESFDFPAILENGNEWMTLTPVDLDTCTEAIAFARGNVVTFGLGLGYYTYMVSEKEEVSSVTAIDISDDAIGMFKKYILPQFPRRDKVRVVKCDAFEYAEKIMPGEKFDFAFVDTWRDVSDGFDMYIRMKRLEKLNGGTEFSYWVEGLILSHLRWLVFEELWSAAAKGDSSSVFGVARIESFDDISKMLSRDSLRRLAADLKRVGDGK